jgi:adenylate kinase
MAINLILMGVQGSGKGTQATYIAEKYNLLHISTGDLFRALNTRDDDFARKIQAILASGKLVSDDDTNDILQDYLDKTDLKNGVLLDGYPRNPAQAQWLEKYLSGKGEALTAVILLELDPYIAFKRAFGRVTAADKSAYNVYYNAEEIEFEFENHADMAYPPRLNAKLKSTGEELKRRPDDASADAVIKRIDLFLNETAPLVDYYNNKGLLSRVNADQPIETVTEQIIQVIEQRKTN